MLNFILACIHLNPLRIVEAGGYIGLALLIYAESGLLFGIFLPGDSLLFAAGLLSAGGFFDPGLLAIVVVFSAILGDSTGYWFGQQVGAHIFKRPDSFFLRHEYLERTQRFYRKYGPRAVVLSRFVPVVRTLAPILAGVGKMRYATFLSYNAIGAFIWGAGMIAVGYWLGSIPGTSAYVLPISAGIIIVSFFPIFLNVFRGKRAV